VTPCLAMTAPLSYPLQCNNPPIIWCCLELLLSAM
jgi:hypothetical protein